MFKKKNRDTDIVKMPTQPLDAAPALEECLINCLQYLICEQGWEWFRVEMLYFNDKEKKKTSEKNAESLRRFIRDQAKMHPRIAELVKIAGERQ